MTIKDNTVITYKAEENPILIELREPTRVFLKHVLDDGFYPFKQALKKNYKQFLLPELKRIDFIFLYNNDDYEFSTKQEVFCRKIAENYVRTASLTDKPSGENMSAPEKYKARKYFDNFYQKYMDQNDEVLEYEDDGFRYAYFKLTNLPFFINSTWNKNITFHKSLDLITALTKKDNIIKRHPYYFISNASDLEDALLCTELVPYINDYYPEPFHRFEYVSTSKHIDRLLKKIKTIQPSIIIKDFSNHYLRHES